MMKPAPSETVDRHAPSRVSQVLVWAACTFGLIHAAFSGYWAFGGDWLLRTVGQWAVRLADAAPVQASIVLAAVALVKVAAAVVPVLNAYGRLPWSRLWRAISWVGASALILYGGANVIIAWLVLSGVITPTGGYDRMSMLGHAVLWDPLFLLWGLALLGHLLLSRDLGRSSPTRSPGRRV
jgi:Protein of unknown function (DUF3995)